MNPSDNNPNPAETPSTIDLEQLLEKVASAEQADSALASQQAKELSKNHVEAFDFRSPMILGAAELRKLRMHQEEFVKALAGRLSQHLRLEFGLQLTGLQTVSYQKFAQSWVDPSHLTLFKIEPLRGISILEIPPRLGLSLVDRLMGGPGHAGEISTEMSEIEKALLEQIVQLILGEWCAHWSRLKELKAVPLGYETNGRYVQGISSETTMLVLKMQAQIGECTEHIQIGLPYPALEILIRQLTQGNEPAKETATAKPQVVGPYKWNPCLDEVCIPISAKWQGFELSARELLALKIGDVLQIDPQVAEKVNVRLDDIPKFNGRLGVVAGKWAVELTQAVKR